jgi:hypothetical protein
VNVCQSRASARPASISPNATPTSETHPKNREEDEPGLFSTQSLAEAPWIILFDHALIEIGKNILPCLAIALLE